MNNKIKLTVDLISLFSFLFCLQASNQFKLIFVLPLALFILNNFFLKLYSYLKHSIVFNFILLQLVIRYSIIPILISSGEVFKIGYNSNYISISIFIMLIELLLVFIVSNYIKNKQYLSYKNRCNEIYFIPFNMKYVFIIFICLFTVLASGYLNKINFIWSLSDFIENTNSEELSGSAIGLISFNFVRIFILLILIGVVHRSKFLKESNKLFYYLFIIMLSAIIIIGTSRLSIVFFSIPFLMLINIIIKEHQRVKLTKFFIIFFIPLIIYTSLAKFSNNNNYDTDALFSISSINAYFSGIGNLNLGLDLYYEDFIYNPKIIFNDLFQNVPLLSKLTTDYKSTTLFNYKIYGIVDKIDQIAPLSITGLMHFGVLGIFIYTPLFLLISYYFERRSYLTNNILLKYVFMSISISSSLIFMLNIGSLVSNIIKNIFFILIPYRLIRFLEKHKNY